MTPRAFTLLEVLLGLCALIALGLLGFAVAAVIFTAVDAVRGDEPVECVCGEVQSVEVIRE